MILRRKNRGTVVDLGTTLEERGGGQAETRMDREPAPITPPNPLLAIRGRLSTRLQYLDDSIRRQDQDKLTMQQEMESLKKQIFEIDRATLAMPILEKLAELYR